MSYRNIKINISTSLAILLSGSLLSWSSLAVADELLANEASHNTPIVEEKLSLQAHIEQMLAGSHSVNNVSDTNSNEDDNNDEKIHSTSNLEKNDIASAIKYNYLPPANSDKGQVVLSIELDKNGKVLSVSASGPNELVNQAAIKAVKKASPLPIDLKNPNDYSKISVYFQTS